MMAASLNDHVSSHPANPAFQIGDTLGDYEIVGLLGRGGMGQVYKVRHRILDRLDAMKVLLPDCQDDPQLRQRFEREIRVQANLHHPNIAELHTALWANDRLLMIIEYVDGVTLERKLHEGPVLIAAGIDCICQVLDALSYAHARGVVHRDVKPANIMIPAAGGVKLTDFGIARPANENLTRAGIAVGSLNYMSPEQIKAGIIDNRSDLYAVGVTLYETLLGKRPIQGDDDQAIMRGHLEQMPVAPSDLSPGFPEVLSRVIMKALAKDPAHRFQTADEFREALRAAGGLGAPAVIPVSSTPVVGLDAAALSHIERCLASAVGPIAKALMARAVRETNDPAVLSRQLAEQIPEESARLRFLKCCERATGETAMRQASGATSLKRPSCATPSPSREWTAEILQQTERELARYIGPLARVMVTQAAKKASTTSQLVELLSGEIPGSKDREAFATSLRRVLG